LDIALGLQVLHSLKVVHGDLKLLNVLLYTNSSTQEGDEERPIVAKLADFGGALLDMHDLVCLPSGTFPWNAPESSHLQQRDRLLATDIYSFGLLVLRIFLDGKNPFKDPTANVYPHALTDREIETEKSDTGFYRKVRDSVHQYLEKSQIRGCDDILNIFDYSLQLEPSQRSLLQVLNVLEANPIARDRR
jgi:serine/threonine protein kinase